MTCVGYTTKSSTNRGYNQRLEMYCFQSAAARSLKTLYTTARQISLRAWGTSGSF